MESLNYSEFIPRSCSAYRGARPRARTSSLAASGTTGTAAEWEQRGDAAKMIHWIVHQRDSIGPTRSWRLSRGEFVAGGSSIRLEQVGVHVQAQHTENGAMEER